MNVLKQVLAEAKNMLRSKFILISMILAFIIITIGVPIFGMVMDKLQEDNMNNYYNRYEEDLVVNGVTINRDNDFYWDIQNLVEQQEHMGDWFQNEKAVDYALELSDLMLDFYVDYAPLLAPRDEDYNGDYRTEFMYSMREYITGMYVLNVMDPDPAALQEAVESISWGGMAVSDLLEMSNEDAAEYTAKAEQDLDDFDKLMKENDFSIYVVMKTRQYEENLQSNLDRIATLEADIIANPDQEEYAAEEIERLEIDNETITETRLPELQYREEHNIIYNDGSWEDEAITKISNSQQSIKYATIYKMTETEFNEDQWSQERYGNYKKYLESIENERKQAEEDLFVAQSSLDSGKPDMDFVPKGARQQLYNTFPLSMLVVVFGAMIGGWCIASEFQSGTIRLLMIRPRTRLVVLLTRFVAGLALTYVLYFVAFVVNMLIQGVQYGFADYMLPNYTASATMNFFVMWFGDMLAVSMNVVFIYSLSFAMSTIIKNMAVSMIVPTLALLGATISMAFLSSQPAMNFIAYTPVPYLTMYDFFGNNWNGVNQMIEKGVPLSLPLGAAVLAVYSVLFMVLAAVIFKKKDITN